MRLEIIRKTVEKEIHMYRSPVLIKKKDAKNWIENKMKNYERVGSMMNKQENEEENPDDFEDDV